MANCSDLPSELIIQIMYFCDFRTVLNVKLLSKYHQELISSSSKLQYLIELGRDGFIPIYSQTPDAAVSLLEEHFRSRENWKKFIIQKPKRSPPRDNEFHIYEFCGGTLAHCSHGQSQDDICFQRLDKPASLDSLNPQMIRVPLAFKCAEFSCDPTQDLLVVVEDCGPNFPIHILSATTGLPHPKAAHHTFDSLVYSISHVIDVEICIADEAISLAYSLQEMRNVAPISVINWVKGTVLLQLTVNGSNSASLLSPRHLMVIRCNAKVTWPGSGLDIYDLCHSATDDSGTPHILPVLTLSLPYLSPLSKYAFRSSYFHHGSNNSVSMDRGIGTLRTGERDVICIVIRMTRSDTDETHYRLILFISRKRLLQLAMEKLSTFNMDHETWLREQEKTQTPNGSNIVDWRINLPVAQVTDRYELHSIEMKYEDWTKHGRYTRWLDGTRTRLISKCAVYGSKFACTVNPEDIGFKASFSSREFAGHVCLLEFNEALFEKEDESTVVRFIDDPVKVALTAELDADVRGGMPFRIRWFKKPSVKTWADVMLDKDHLVARLLDGFDIFTI